jgi:hypothetical protein
MIQLKDIDEEILLLKKSVEAFARKEIEPYYQ